MFHPCFSPPRRDSVRNCLPVPLYHCLLRPQLTENSYVEDITVSVQRTDASLTRPRGLTLSLRSFKTDTFTGVLYVE